jgi:hypothetical protein
VRDTALVHLIFEEPEALECAETIELTRQSRLRSAERLGMKSVNGTHTDRCTLGRKWLGEIVKRRLKRAGISGFDGRCWANILPPGAEYSPHNHPGQDLVAVWCLSGNGALRLEPDVVIPDQAGQLVVFSGSTVHWVPKVDHERITVAVNLTRTKDSVLPSPHVL